MREGEIWERESGFGIKIIVIKGVGGYCGSAERVAEIEVMPSRTDKQIKTDKTIRHSLMSFRRLLLINI